MENNIQEFTKRSCYNDDDSGKIFLFTMIAPLLLSIVLSMIGGQIAKQRGVEVEEITSNIWFLVVFSTILFIVYFAIFFVYNKCAKVENKAINLKFKMPWHTYLIAIVVGAVSLFGIQYFINSFDDLWRVIGMNLNVASINPTDFGTFVVAVIVLAVFPAITEELIFRGVVFNGLRSRFSDWQAIALSSLMFALMHGNLQQLIYPFLLGMVMSWMVLRTGSLVSSILVHFTNNFLVVLMTYIQNITGFTMNIAHTWWFYLLAVILLGLTVGIYFIIDRFYFKHKAKEEVEKTSTKTSIFVYISLAISMVIFIVQTSLMFIKL